jgi:hypothetical protein
MGVRRRVLAAVAIVCALAGVGSARALASATEQSSLMDDDELIYSPPDHVAQRLAQIKSLGIDRVKVSVVWSLVAPDAASTKRPKFDPTDPRAYPYGAWDRYDEIVRKAAELGMGVYFQLDPPVPVWAIPARQSVRQGPVLGHTPDARQFAQFAQAVGRRYDGTFAPDLPRVSYWGIWNEPNERSWLNPWYRSLAHRRQQLLQPAAYRGLVDGAWRGLMASGHRGDTILLGETANKGIIKPVPFVRDVYCVSSSYRSLRGTAASLLGCPRSGNRASFVRAHPALFQMTGYAHHPYTFDAPPNTPNPDPDVIAMSSLNLFERQITRVFAAYGVRRPGGIPLYLTEWGYKTRPPNPYVRTSLSQQAAWLDQGEFMTYENRDVQALTQFELVDSGPKAGTRRGSSNYWSTFQTGLLYQNGAPKPSYTTFRMPIWVPRPRHGSRVTVWGQFRSANHSSLQYGEIEYRRAGQGEWATVREVQTSSPEGFLVAHVALPAAGAIRLAWLDPGGTTYYSRTVAIG